MDTTERRQALLRLNARSIAVSVMVGSVLTVLAVGPGAVRLSAQEERDPPPFELKVDGVAMQRAGVGTFCWIWGCVRKIGILTSAQPYVFMGDLDAVLDLDYREAPSGLSATIYPVTIETDMTDVGEGMVAWRPSSPGSSVPLIASLEQPLRLSPAPGLYVLSVGAAWPGEPARDVIYGFFLQVEDSGSPSPTPTATVVMAHRLWLAWLGRLTR